MEKAILTAPQLGAAESGASRAGVAAQRDGGDAAETRTLPRLWIERLRLSAFRNYAEAEIRGDGRPVVLSGPNGAGKTNLLEAISLLAPGRGLRRARLAEVERQPALGSEGGSAPRRPWAVAARVETPEGPRELGTGRDPAAASGERRALRLDGAPAGSQQALGEVLQVTWLTPQMDRLFVESPAGRRRFLDRLVYALDPAHAGRVAKYEHALRERARLLKDTRGADPAWLGALEQRMAEQGVAIAVARRMTVERLDRACRLQPGAEAGFPRAGLRLEGDAESWLDESSALEVEDRLKAALAEGRRRDADLGGTGVGPQRSDFGARHLDKGQDAQLCSTGEQKALLIAIVLAHARLLALEAGCAPLILLDEVAAHLDRERRAGLFEAILALGSQAWMTGTDRTLFEDLDGRAQFFEVREAVVRPA